MSRTARAAGLLLGFAADRALGDPARFHPVAGFGALAAGLERRVYADRRARGAGYTASLVLGTVVAGTLAERACRGRRAATVALTALATWTVLGGRTLDREAAAVGALLESGDLPAARRQVSRLVGRRTEALDEPEVARAVVESVAENTADAVVAPLVWGALAGVPGLLGYRAVNTLDAMVGHHSPRYERFGWASARLDDLANLPASRLTATLALVLARAVGGSPREAWRTWRRDAVGHPSPNAGPVEAAFAGALGVRLGGVNEYAGGVEDRSLLGDGPPPVAIDVARSRRLATLVGVAAVVTAVVAAVAGGLALHHDM